MVEKVLKTLTVDNKDVRKGDWTNKEVRITNRDTFIFFPSLMKKSSVLE